MFRKQPGPVIRQRAPAAEVYLNAARREELIGPARCAVGFVRAFLCGTMVVHPGRGCVTLDRIDSQGYRANVGIILSDESGLVLLGGRIGQSGWQFPQGGIRVSESPEQAMYRELGEEIGLGAGDVEVMGVTRGWLRYRLPERYVRREALPLCIGQKQRWFLLRLHAPKERLRPDMTATPEFDRWRWVGYWQPVEEVIHFKRRVYRRALQQLAPLLTAPPPPPAGPT
jgi:putative (di)nucleoside polyphosphate hydrolase